MSKSFLTKEKNLFEMTKYYYIVIINNDGFLIKWLLVAN